VLIHLL
jgi:hypothetical protein